MVSIEHELFETPVPAGLPGLEFRPGIVWLRRCEGCGQLDRGTWYASSAEAAGRETRRSGCWTCPGCASVSWRLVRSWFDTVYAAR